MFFFKNISLIQFFSALIENLQSSYIVGRKGAELLVFAFCNIFFQKYSSSQFFSALIENLQSSCVLIESAYFARACISSTESPVAFAIFSTESDIVNKFLAVSMAFC